jgi:ribose 5-phosphate isomerase A
LLTWYELCKIFINKKFQFDSLHDLAELEKTINNIPGVLNNGLFVGLADLVIVGELQDGQPLVREF